LIFGFIPITRKLCYKTHFMKLNLYAAIALITATALISCAGTNENDFIDKSIVPPGSEKKTAQPAEAIATQNTGAVPANTTIIPGTSNQPQPININPQNNVVTTSPQPMTAQPAVAAGMNPPHGQPGHRCDIAVGAPLNSKPAPATAQPVAVSTKAQPRVTMTEIPNTQKTAPGMNPPHGQPGHRCDIAVGAPLNSKPAPATTQPTTVSTQPQVTTTDATPAQKTAPGMNPPHGQPGHRCDIAVGAPLNSKPVPPAAIPVQTNTPAPLLIPSKTDSTKN
jgi:hypothetical protein